MISSTIHNFQFCSTNNRSTIDDHDLLSNFFGVEASGISVDEVVDVFENAWIDLIVGLFKTLL